MRDATFVLGFRRDLELGSEEGFGEVVPFTEPRHEGILRQLKERPCFLPRGCDEFMIKVHDGLEVADGLLQPMDRITGLMMLAMDGWKKVVEVQEKILASPVLRLIGDEMELRCRRGFDVERQIDVIPTQHNHVSYPRYTDDAAVVFKTLLFDDHRKCFIVRGYPLHSSLHEWANNLLLEELRRAALEHMGSTLAHSNVAIA